MLALVWQVAQPAPAAQAPAPDSASAPQVQMGVSVQPDTVTVGEHFVVRVRVRAPKGAEIGFPVGPDSGAAVEAVDPKREHARARTRSGRRAYRDLSARRVGRRAQHVTLGSFVVSTAGVDERFAIPEHRRCS